MSRAELEAALRRDPADEQAWTVFGDLLAEAGDSRGELIALEQQARASARPFERSLLEHQARELFDRDHRRWLGSLADAGLEITWTRGFATEVAITRQHASTLERLLELPTAGLLRRLVLVGPRSLRRIAAILAARTNQPIEALLIRGLTSGSIAPLATLTGLVDLRLEATSLTELELLAELPRLRSLTLRRCAGPLTGLSATDPSFQRLESLEISAHANVEQLGPVGLAPLAKLGALRELDLGDAGWPDVDALAELTALERLDLRSTEVLVLEPLRRLTALRELNCSGCSGLSNLEPLRELGQLERIRLAYTRVRDLRPLAALAQLHTLELAGTPVSDLSPLFGLERLRKLDLKACEVHDIAPLLARGVVVHGIRAPERSWRDVAEDHLRRSIIRR